MTQEEIDRTFDEWFNSWWREDLDPMKLFDAAMSNIVKVEDDENDY